MRGVQTGPGAIAFTLMPLSMRCVASPLVNVVMAPYRSRFTLSKVYLSALTVIVPETHYSACCTWPGCMPHTTVILCANSRLSTMQGYQHMTHRARLLPDVLSKAT